MTNQTKQIIKEIAKDSGRSLARAGKVTLEGIAQVACKASYPILGNLSNNLQTRFENLFGKEYYCTNDAVITSKIINYLAIPLGAIYFTQRYFGTFFTERIDSQLLTESGKVLAGKVVAGTLAGAISILELQFEQFRDKKVAASLPGKIVSLPFDALTYAYDSGKRYLQEVKRRFEA
jgi:hypothetical protein